MIAHQTSGKELQVFEVGRPPGHHPNLSLSPQALGLLTLRPEERLGSNQLVLSLNLYL